VDEYCERDRVSVLAYCLMDNHFHLLLKQDGMRSLSGAMRSILTSYAKHTNWKYGLVGHLFQGPFQSRWISTVEHLVYASRYIHRNPDKFADILTYRWSSYRQYTGTSSGLANPEPILEMFESKASYTTYVESVLTPEIARRQGRFYLAENPEPASPLAGSA
jgi:putative transposase